MCYCTDYYSDYHTSAVNIIHPSTQVMLVYEYANFNRGCIYIY